MRKRTLALAAFILIPLTAQAQGTLSAERKRLQSADYRVNGHLVRVDAAGARTSYGVNIKAHWFPGVLRVAMEVMPGSAKTVPQPQKTAPSHILLEMRPGGESSIQIAHPGDASPVALPFDKWAEGPLGAGFSYEDFLEATYFWAVQTPQGDAKFGARDCELVKSTPGAADRTHYAEVKSWLDRGSGFPVHEEKTLKGSGTVKEFTSFGLRQTEGVWSATQVEVKIRGQSGSTLLIIERGTPKAHLNLKDFSPAQLTHF